MGEKGSKTVPGMRRVSREIKGLDAVALAVNIKVNKSTVGWKSEVIIYVKKSFVCNLNNKMRSPA